MKRPLGVVTAAVVLGLLAAPLAVGAQRPGQPRRIGVLAGREGDALREGLRELGWVEGQNVVFEYRSSGRQLDQMAAAAAELVRLEPEVIVAGSAAAAMAVKRVTRAIPVVFILVADPVADGLVASLAHPGGNLTGLTTLSRELGGKRLQLLAQVVPNLSRVAVVYNPADPGAAGGIGEQHAAARTLGLTLQLVQVRSPDEIDTAFSAIKQWRAQALAVPPGPFAAANQARIEELALKLRLPTVYASRSFAERGGLMAYGPSYGDLARRAAAYVDKILRGAKPADLPVEQPTKFELVVNLRTAKALGVVIPQSVLIQADEIVQ
jgi:putative ABC transport system substrate-binding protein